MKEAKFIELLNLYIDQQISPQEANSLEDEICRNQQRRQVYQEYCKMHRACALVFENMTRGGQVATEPVLERITVSPRRRMWGYYAGALAAAACLAVVTVPVVLHRSPVAKPVGIAAAPAPLKASAGSERSLASAGSDRWGATVIPANLTAEPFTLQHLLVSSPLRVQVKMPFIIRHGPDGTPPMQLLLTTEAAASPNRPSIDQFVFEQSDSSAASATVYRSRSQTGDPAEMSAFQFQK